MEERMDARFKEQEEKIDAKIDSRFKEQEEKIDAKFAQQAIDIAEQFHMAFESAERIHNQMEARNNKRIDKVKKALQF